MNEAGYDSKYSAHRQYIVEVCYYVIGVVKYDVQRGVG